MALLGMVGMALIVCYVPAYYLKWQTRGLLLRLIQITCVLAGVTAILGN